MRSVVLVEDLADQPQLTARDDLAAAVGGGDSGRLLAAVLQRVEREVGEPRRPRARVRRCRTPRTRRGGRRASTSSTLSTVTAARAPLTRTAPASALCVRRVSSSSDGRQAALSRPRSRAPSPPVWPITRPAPPLDPRELLGRAADDEAAGGLAEQRVERSSGSATLAPTPPAMQHSASATAIPPSAMSCALDEPRADRVAHRVLGAPATAGRSTRRQRRRQRARPAAWRAREPASDGATGPTSAIAPPSPAKPSRPAARGVGQPADHADRRASGRSARPETSL